MSRGSERIHLTLSKVILAAGLEREKGREDNARRTFRGLSQK